MVTRGWREGEMDSDCLRVRSFLWGDDHILELDNDDVVQHRKCTKSH